MNLVISNKKMGLNDFGILFDNLEFYLLYLGCLLLYLKFADLLHEVEKNFLVFGNIFQMRCWRQKVVFVNGTEVSFII